MSSKMWKSVVCPACKKPLQFEIQNSEGEYRLLAHCSPCNGEVHPEFGVVEAREFLFPVPKPLAKRLAKLEE